MNKKVIYTSIVGSCDNLQQPNAIRDDYDYICFTQDKSKSNKRNGVWQFRYIPFVSDDSRKLSRYPKLLPHKVLPDYDYSLWIDGNVTINDEKLYEVVDKKIGEDVIYSGVNHWGRDCAYEEAVGCVNTGKETLSNAIKVIQFLKSKEFPKHYGLYENNVIFRKHNSSQIVLFDNMWWKTYLEIGQRDQLCHPYCYREVGLNFNYLLPKSYCARNHPYFIYKPHLNKYQPKGFEKVVYDISRKMKVIAVKVVLSV